jgi:hypothetical protein
VGVSACAEQPGPLVSGSRPPSSVFSWLVTGPRKSSTRPRPANVRIARGGGAITGAPLLPWAQPPGRDPHAVGSRRISVRPSPSFFLLPLVSIVALRSEICEEPNTSVVVDSLVHRRFGVAAGS